jgi:peptidoglycan hydrolase-like protein with peptidoglycan-binding domain
MALFDELFAPYHPFGSRTLVSGAVGTDVAVLQGVYNEMLLTMNPPAGPMGKAISISGTFDCATELAVRSVQSYFGVGVDGVVGPVTFFCIAKAPVPTRPAGDPYLALAN